jgi:DNA invertase Pin-like site-specific DNA recombinase
VDEGVSGAKESRPALNRLMPDAHRRRFAALLVWKVDRFGRSLRHLVNALADLDAAGVSFVSVRDNLDLSTPSGRLMFQVVGAMAEFEGAPTQERVRAGLRLVKSKGKRLGCRVQPWMPNRSLHFGHPVPCGGSFLSGWASASAPPAGRYKGVKKLLETGAVNA